MFEVVYGHLFFAQILIKKGPYVMVLDTNTYGPTAGGVALHHYLD